MKNLLTILGVSVLAAGTSGAAVIWNVGAADNAQLYTAGNPGPGGGGPNTRFVQENGGVNPLPGNPASPNGDTQSDDDYYLAGVYSTQVDGGAAYGLVGVVAANENNAARAFLHNSPAGGDRTLRYHFNFPATTSLSDLITVTFGITGMENVAATPANAWNVAVLVNGVSQGSFNMGTAASQNGDFTTTPFTLGSINSTAGAGPDNYVTLIGTSINPNDPAVVAGGSRWLSLDYVQMDVTPVPEPTSFSFLALVAGGLLLIRRRRR